MRVLVIAESADRAEILRAGVQLGGHELAEVLPIDSALSPALGGTFLRTGLVDFLYLSELIGAILMFLGFILATFGQAETYRTLENAAH